MDKVADSAGEIIDLVDQNDLVIGEVEKNEANQNPHLIHREIAIFIFDNQNRVLIQQRSSKKKIFPGSWTISCAGHILKGELPEVAAHREMREELGFDTKLIFVEKILLNYSNETHFTYLYFGKHRDEKITIQTEEIDKIKFITAEELTSFTQTEDLRNKSKQWMLEFWEGKFDEYVRQLI